MDDSYYCTYVLSIFNFVGLPSMHEIVIGTGMLPVEVEIQITS